jgi:hypothetical protein
VTPSEALERALDRAMEGLACFPCNADKSPACVRGFRSASADPAVLEYLWQCHPAPLVGIATGTASNLDILDIDAKHAQARDWWEAHRTRLLPTRAQRTRSGGIHLFFRHRPGMRCSTGRVARGVDIRADGGYIIDWRSAGLPVLSFDPVAQWPEWFAVPTPPQPAVTNESASAWPPSRTGTAVSYGRAALKSALTRITAAPDGSQEVTINREAYSLGTLIANGELSRSEVENDLLTIGDQLVSYDPTSPWRPEEVKRKMLRALAAGTRHPRRRHG